MTKAIVPSYVVALLLIGFSGCDKNSGEAVVLAKDYRRAVHRRTVAEASVRCATVATSPPATHIDANAWSG